MKIFDAHSDIFTDIIQKIEEGDSDILAKSHINNFIKGDVFGSIFVVWTEPKYNYSRERTLKILESGMNEINLCSDYIKHIKSYNDFEIANKEGKLAIMLGIEGMAFINYDVDYINTLYDLGVRHIGLTWNEENELATGVRGNKHRGLTKLGIKAIDTIEKLGIVLDVSHLNERSFWDVCEHSKKPFIASHSNVYSLCDNPRNLKDDQIKAIKNVNGVIGVNAWPHFVDKKSPSVEKMADHIDYIVNLIGVDYVGLGFDFCEFISNEATPVFNQNANIIDGLYHQGHVQSIMNVLAGRGYTESDLRKIGYENFFRVFKEIL
ncbi:dipeptidase [Alkalithermobacter paradoxus]|uniref:Membrane dipeptidase n=1 Tax=Alkalithermobacter paradoxus TaxID=29349 RepID=A0A1V4I605_9FIRM|nr:membrane dipeptidase [[Clostridium] thermoalcaliphilum]